MNLTSPSPAAARASRQANAERYRPRAVRPVPAAPAIEDPRFVRLTRQVLEELKHPHAIPSQVVMRALKEAAALEPRKTR